MTTRAELTLKGNRFLGQQGTECTAEFNNDGREMVSDLNPGNIGGAPTLLLTKVATTEVSWFHESKATMMPPIPVDVPPGTSFCDVFNLSERVSFPEPGEYDLQARFDWQTGEMTSPPVRVEVLPADPRILHVVSPYGGLGGGYLILWVNQAGEDRKNRELWLSRVVMQRKPRVTGCTCLGEIPHGTDAFISVPPNCAPHAQWVAWSETPELGYLLYRRERVSAPEKTPLGGDQVKIIPPLIEVQPRGGGASSAQVMLFDPGQETGRAQILVKTLSPGRDAEPPPSLRWLGPEPLWAETVGLSSQMRHTFFAVWADGKTMFKVASWTALRPPRHVSDLMNWEAICRAAECCVTQEDVVRGAVVAQSEAGLAFIKWTFRGEGRFASESAHRIDWSRGKVLGRAVVRVNAMGEPYALLQEQDRDKLWYLATPDGKVSAIAGPPEVAQVPADILFRRGYDPTILYTDPGRGFQLVKPG